MDVKPILSPWKLPLLRYGACTDSQKNQQCFPVIIVGSTAYKQQVLFYWGESHPYLLKGLSLPEGIDENLLKMSLEPRDIDISVKQNYLLEEIAQIASQWIKKARNACTSELGITKIQKGDEFTEGNLIIKRVILYKDMPDHPSPRKKNIVYTIDLSQSIDNRSYNEKIIRERLLIQGIDKIIESESRLTQLGSGMEQRTIKAIVRLFILGALECVLPKLDPPSRSLLAQALQDIPYQDTTLTQLAQTLVQSGADIHPTFPPPGLNW